ncbi:MAG: protease inhibitor I42 family protein [Bacillota bacterium]
MPPLTGTVSPRTATVAAAGPKLVQVRLNEQAEFKPDSNLLGSGGKTTYRFEAAVPGQTWLSLDYHRPWEKDVPALKTFEVLIIVN